MLKTRILQNLYHQTYRSYRNFTAVTLSKPISPVVISTRQKTWGNKTGKTSGVKGVLLLRFLFFFLIFRFLDFYIFKNFSNLLPKIDKIGQNRDQNHQIHSGIKSHFGLINFNQVRLCVDKLLFGPRTFFIHMGKGIPLVFRNNFNTSVGNLTKFSPGKIFTLQMKKSIRPAIFMDVS